MVFPESFKIYTASGFSSHHHTPSEGSWESVKITLFVENLGAIVEPMKKYLVRPEPNNPALTQRVDGVDHANNAINTLVPVERPLTLFLNSQEIVTVMTIGDFPEDLALGFLLNQKMLTGEDIVTAVEHEPDINVVVVRTERETDFEEQTIKKNSNFGLCARHGIR